jgi:hypothetical protein
MFRTPHWPPLTPLAGQTRSNSLCRDPPPGKSAPDEEDLFIRDEEPFGYHPKMGVYPDLDNSLLSQDGGDALIKQKTSVLGGAHSGVPPGIDSLLHSSRARSSCTPGQRPGTNQ